MEPRDHNDEDDAFMRDVPSGEDESPPQRFDLEPDDSGDAKPSPAQLLLQLAEAQYRLIRSTEGRTYAVPKEGPNLALPLGSRSGTGLRTRLAMSLRRRTGKVASGSAQSDCIAVLEGEAAELEPEPVFLRMGRHEDPETGRAVIVDLGTATGTCVVITADGWTIQPAAPVVFRRSELIHPLPEPTRDGSLEGLRDLLNLSEDDFRLAIGWVVAAYFTDMAHPILFVQGEQGTGKSGLVRCLLSLIDPQPANERSTPADKREWAIFGRASWAFCFDNITEIPEWLSNSLCRGVTGDAVLQRVLQSDDEIAIFSFQRVMAMTTIALKHELAGDLADRMLLIEPQVIEVRRSEEDILAARSAALPQALGAIMSLVASTLKQLPDTHVEDLPRMADFARVLAALDTHTGWNTLATYRGKVTEMGQALIEGDNFAQALFTLARQESVAWEGTAKELIVVLQQLCAQHQIANREIPDEPRAIGRRIRELAPSLRKVGVDVRFLPRTKTSRRLRIQPLREDQEAVE